jgi:uncharacterized protein Usg
MLIRRKHLVTVDIFYYRPDYQNIIQEFLWQTEDQIPEYYRVHKFLNHWKNNIDAVIKEIFIATANTNRSSYRSIDEFFNLH